jgi:hypothetical protein
MCVGFWLTAIYSGLRLDPSKRQILRLLKVLSYPTYQKLGNTFLKVGISPLKFSKFLHSNELNDIPEVLAAKEHCRGWWRWTQGSMIGFVVSAVLAIIVGAISTTLE